jgi:hypothetical protein
MGAGSVILLHHCSEGASGNVGIVTFVYARESVVALGSPGVHFGTYALTPTMVAPGIVFS